GPISGDAQGARPVTAGCDRPVAGNGRKPVTPRITFSLQPAGRGTPVPGPRGGHTVNRTTAYAGATGAPPPDRPVVPAPSAPSAAPGATAAAVPARVPGVPAPASPPAGRPGASLPDPPVRDLRGRPGSGPHALPFAPQDAVLAPGRPGRRTARGNAGRARRPRPARTRRQRPARPALRPAGRRRGHRTARQRQVHADAAHRARPPRRLPGHPRPLGRPDAPLPAVRALPAAGPPGPLRGPAPHPAHRRGRRGARLRHPGVGAPLAGPRGPPPGSAPAAAAPRRHPATGPGRPARPRPRRLAV